MNILIVGNGGREHALAWKAQQCNDVSAVFVAPGNAGTELSSGITNIDIAATDIDRLLDFAQQNNIYLTIVGPEVPLVAGIVDQFQAAGQRIFGPGKNAAQLEGSKSFCKAFLEKYKIPTAGYQVFTDVEEARNYIKRQGTPLAIKADGLAAGKGVIIAFNEDQAIAAVEDMLAANKFGSAGSKVVIEEFLEGHELSFICIVDGDNILPLATSQDHKARDEGDQGPNTGGMGAYSPAASIDEKLQQHIINDIIEPTVRGMQQDGNRFTGFLYAGLMIDSTRKARVIEYNVRFGDPETQPILMRLESDLIALCNAAVDGTLDQQSVQWSDQTAIGVVMAAGGYPESYQSGAKITGIENTATEVEIFHAGSAIVDGNLVTSGGRVLCVTALGRDIVEARKNAYEAVEKISWEGAFYRRDIGHRALR